MGRRIVSGKLYVALQQKDDRIRPDAGPPLEKCIGNSTLPQSSLQHWLQQLLRYLLHYR
jgi:hypothetical protein